MGRPQSIDKDERLHAREQTFGFDENETVYPGKGRFFLR